jgi:hypothetical protein
MCATFAVHSFAQGLFRVLGLSGNTYKTEVHIPIQQIRYQSGYAVPVIITYEKTAINKLPLIDSLLIYSLYSAPTSAIPLIKLKPCVKFLNTDGSTFTPSASQPAPPGGAILVKCSCDDPGVIKSSEYLFVPEGSKMPNFSQLLAHQWFVSGPFSALFKYRPTVSARDDAPEIKGAYQPTGFSIGIITGTKHSLVSLPNGGAYKIPVTLQLPLFMFGVNNTDVQLRVRDSITNRYKAKLAAKENRVVFTFATGVGVQVGSFGVMALAGWDNLLGVGKEDWPYQHHVWYGFSVGVSLDKLVGLSK